MEAFVYTWTDWKTNQLYIGWHKGSVDDGYICSSKVMLEEYKKRPQDFTRQIVASGSSADMVNFEAVLLKGFDAKHNENFYNMHNGDGKFILFNHTQESKDKISASKKGTKRPDVTLRNLTHNPAEGKYCGRPMQGELNPMYGKKHSDESRELMSQNRKGKGKQPKSAETKRKMAEARRLYWAKKRGEI